MKFISGSVAKEIQRKGIDNSTQTRALPDSSCSIKYQEYCILELNQNHVPPNKQEGTTLTSTSSSYNNYEYRK